MAFLQGEATLPQDGGWGWKLMTQTAGGGQTAEVRVVAGAHLEEAVGVHVIHVHVDHSEQALDLLETHLTILVRVSPVQVGVDPGVGAQEIPATGWALPLADR